MSHASPDKALVERLSRDLMQEGLRPWLDKWDLEPGRSWQKGLEDGLAACPAVLVCIGRDLGPWQVIELEAALIAAARDPHKLVIPVWLPGAADRKAAPFLERLNGVKFGSDWAAGARQVAHAVQGRPGGPPNLDTTTCPYRGMEVFDEQHARWMYGREAEIQNLLAHLRDRSPLLPLLGASGSGKSSLVRAGLVPAVRTGELDGSFDWRIAITKPGRSPLRSLALAVLRLAGDDASRLALPAGRDPVEELAARARQSPFFANAVAQIAGDADKPAGVLLVMDQFEELFTEADVDESRTLVGNLLCAVEDDRAPRVHVVLTLRADFMPQCLQWPELATALDGAMRVALPAMGRRQVADAVRRPALSVGAAVEPAVVAALVDGVAGQAGTLPLLQHCLIEMWGHRDLESNTLTWAAYEAVGGLRGAIARTADSLLGDLSDDDRPAVRRVLGRLIHLGQGTGDTRRYAPLAEFEPGTSAKAALDALVARRLVTVGNDRAEIAHEALLRQWDTLHAWLQEDRANLQLRQDVTTAAEAWERADRSGDMLWRGGRLTRAAEVLLAPEAPVAITSVERGFLEAGLAAMEAETRAAQEEAAQKAEAQRQQLRLARRAFRASGVAAAVLLLAVVGVAALSGAAWRQSLLATAATRMASARLAAADEDFAAAKVLLADVRPIPVRAWWFNSALEWRNQPTPYRILRAHSARINAVAFSPDGQAIVTASEDRTAHVWNAEGTGDPIVLGIHRDGVTAAAFRSDGKKVVTVSGDNTVRVWNADGSGGEPVVLAGPVGRQPNLFFSPDGRTIVTTSEGSTAHVQSVDGSATPIVLRGHTGPVTSVAFRRDGKRIITGSADTTARVWDADGGGRPLVLQGHGGPVTAAEFSPDGTLIVTASEDNTARVWKADGSGKAAILRGHTDWVRAVAFSPDGKTVVTASLDKTARVLNDFDSGRSTVLRGHTDLISDVAFSPTGHTIVTTSWDGTARLWKAEGATADVIIQSHTSYVNCASFSPDGKTIVTASDDQTSKTWRLDGSSPPVVLQGHTSYVNYAAFSPDGEAIVSASSDATARIWKTKGNGSPIELSGHTSIVWSAQFSPDGQSVVTASNDGTARVWRRDRRGATIVIKADEGSMRFAAFSPDGKTIVTAENNTARIRSADGTGETVVLDGHSDEVLAAAFSPDGRQIVTASIDKTARIWNADGTGQPIVLDGHEGAVFMAAFSPDGKAVVTASSDKTARVWRRDGRGPVIVLKGHTGDVYTAAFSPDGKTVVTASGDRTVRLWDAEVSQIRASLREDSEPCIGPKARMRYLGEDDATAQARFRGCERKCYSRTLEEPIEHEACPWRDEPLQPSMNTTLAAFMAQLSRFAQLLGLDTAER